MSFVFSKKYFPIVYMITILLVSFSCKKSDPVEKLEEEVVDEAEEDTLAMYIPKEFQGMDFDNAASTWSNTRSQHSEHFILFWGKDYGKRHPNSSEVPDEYRVDIDELLERAEQFYALNIGTLGFAELGVGRSNLDKYKIMIFLHYTTEWMAYGGGYDDVIGALWISPATCKPVGVTIAHEIGHSFQYQVRCDLGGVHGFRYGFGGNDGNGFWEQTAQWQAHQSYPAENFQTHHFNVYTENYHRHQIHEWYRYANYFIHHYWVDTHGIDIVGKVWREAVQPEDPIQAYKRIVGITDQQLNDEVYDMAKKFVTWDIDALRSLGKDYIGKHTYKFDVQNDGSLRVAYDHAPGTTGYNVIPLEVPAPGTEVSISFTGLTNEAGFNPIDHADRAGWRYGVVALLQDGTRMYGDMNTEPAGVVDFTVPQQTNKLWFVVTGAPITYAVHAWDEDESNDEQWPYKIKIHNSGVVGYLTFEEDDEPEDVTFTYDVSFLRDAAEYSGVTVNVDQSALGRAFVLQPNQIAPLLGNKVKFYAVEPNGGLNATTTANGYGHWFNATGDVINWGEGAMLFSEFDESALKFSLGQYPDRVVAGTIYTIRQALVYEYETGSKVEATFVFNVKIE